MGGTPPDVSQVGGTPEVRLDGALGSDEAGVAGGCCVFGGGEPIKKPRRDLPRSWTGLISLESPDWPELVDDDTEGTGAIMFLGPMSREAIMSPGG